MGDPGRLGPGGARRGGAGRRPPRRPTRPGARRRLRHRPGRDRARPPRLRHRGTSTSTRHCSTAARAKAPTLTWQEADLASLPADVAAGPFAAAVLAGNVMIFVARGTERAVLANLAPRLAPGGLVVAGFQLSGRSAARRVRRGGDRGGPRAPGALVDLGPGALHRRGRLRGQRSRAGLEAVAHPGLGEEVARPARLGLELAAHVGHVHA